MSDARGPKGKSTPKPSAETTSGETGKADGPKVGYKQPPLHSRIKAGQVLNPKGRLVGSKNKRKPKHDTAIIDMILADADQEITVRGKNGDRVPMKRLQAVILGLSNQAFKGGVFASKYYIDLVLSAARARQADLEETAAALGEIKLWHYEIMQKVKAGQIKKPGYLIDADALYMHRDGRVAARYAATDEDKARWNDQRQQYLVLIKDAKKALKRERDDAQRFKRKQELEVFEGLVGSIDAALSGSREAMGYLDEMDLAVKEGDDG